jgi:hypothetical protein
LSLAGSTLMDSLYSCGLLFVMLMRNDLKGLYVSGAATFSKFVTKTCDLDQNEDLIKRYSPWLLIRSRGKVV